MLAAAICVKYVNLEGFCRISQITYLYSFKSYDIPYIAYDGDLCQNDADGCEAISCLEGQACMDLPEPTAGAMCACPVGYLDIDSKCVGKTYAYVDMHKPHV